MEADIRHTASWKKAIDSVSDHDQEIIDAAERSLICQNILLDSCYEEYC